MTDFDGLDVDNINRILKRKGEGAVTIGEMQDSFTYRKSSLTVANAIVAKRAAERRNAKLAKRRK